MGTAGDSIGTVKLVLGAWQGVKDHPPLCVRWSGAVSHRGDTEEMRAEGLQCSG
jgi:hypothetical protein